MVAGVAAGATGVPAGRARVGETSAILLSGVRSDEAIGCWEAVRKLPRNVAPVAIAQPVTTTMVSGMSDRFLRLDLGRDSCGECLTSQVQSRDRGDNFDRRSSATHDTDKQL